MNRFQPCFIMIVLLSAALTGAAESDSLFPNLEDAEQEQQPSLESAITQFEDIIQDSGTGSVEVMNSNDSYNQERIKALKAQLKQKQAYLDALPGIISERFEALMLQHPQADQKTKNRMAEELHAHWRGKEEQAKLEVTHLQEQLAIAEGRLSNSAVQRQMLDISSSLSESERTLAGLGQPKPVDPQARSSVFQTMMGLSQKRTLSKLTEFCALRVKPMESELSLAYLDD